MAKHVPLVLAAMARWGVPGRTLARGLPMKPPRALQCAAAAGNPITFPASEALLLLREWLGLEGARSWLAWLTEVPSGTLACAAPSAVPSSLSG